MKQFTRKPDRFSEKPILLLTINAKWIHPSLALRLLKANLGSLENRCEIAELALRQSLEEKLAAVTAVRPGILGISVSIWNHSATIELLKKLEKKQAEKPVIILGGPEVSHLPPDAEIFTFANYVICGEGELAFASLCKKIIEEGIPQETEQPQFIIAEPVNISEIKSGYYLYSAEDLAKKLIYVEASRGCPFSCEFCLSAVKTACGNARESPVREFPLETFFAEMDDLIKRGVKTFKFLDRSFNINTKRALEIMDFFLSKIEEKKRQPFVVHFEMVPFLFPAELLETLARFPPGTLRLEIGFQTFNPQTASLIGRACNPQKELEALRLLREKTNAIIHADLIIGLPGEDIVSFGNGFDRLWTALAPATRAPQTRDACTEIQAGILKLLPGAPISRHSESYGMRYSPVPPYEVIETSAIPEKDLKRLKNFARFWELIVNRNLAFYDANKPVFSDFMALSDLLAAHFGRNWGIDKNELKKIVQEHMQKG